MYNINNLDSVEFEKFCLDYMEKVTGKRMKRFGLGKDDGIDLESIDGKIICQCKRYESSSITKKKISEEYDKIKDLDFEEYYFLTSKSLTPNMTNIIFNTFNKYMKDKSHIIAKEDINDFLSKKENIDILKRNHKLWFLSSNVLDLYLNKYVKTTSKLEIKKMKETEKLFVETKAYYDAIDIIENKNILLLIGNPGVGKTITSRMVIYYLLLNYKDYDFIYTPKNDISKLIESIDEDSKQIIFLDDFLGQTCSNIDFFNLKELDSLLGFIKNNKNKKLILNSRITIYNKAKEENEFSKLLYDMNLEEYIIDVNDISKLDRARILYNFLYVNKIPYKDFLVIKDNYNKIIRHRSYSARIIEYSIIQYKNESKSLYEIIINNLDNPEGIWKDEFKKLEEIDRIIMYNLYILGDDYIPYMVLKECVDNYLLKYNINPSNYSFRDSINRLNKSLISRNLIGNNIELKVLNPSINDYIQNVIKEDSVLQRRLLLNSSYIEQINKLVNINNENINYISLDNIKSYSTDKYTKILSFIYKYKYLNDNIKGLVKDIFNDECYSNIKVLFLLNKELRDFYNLSSYLNNIEKCSKIFEVADYDSLFELFEYYFDNDIMRNSYEMKFYFGDKIEEVVENKLIDDCYMDLENYLFEMDISDKYELSSDEKKLEVDHLLKFKLDSYLDMLYESNLNSIISDFKKINLELNRNDIYKPYVLENVDIDEIIDTDCYNSRKYFDIKESENIKISEKDVFNQNYNTNW